MHASQTRAISKKYMTRHKKQKTRITNKKTRIRSKKKRSGDLKLEHEDCAEDLCHISKGDAGLSWVHVLGEELQPELEDSGAAKGSLLTGQSHMLLNSQALQHLYGKQKKG